MIIWFHRAWYFDNICLGLDLSINLSIRSVCGVVRMESHCTGGSDVLLEVITMKPRNHYYLTHIVSQEGFLDFNLAAGYR